jgi:hypothetical protein
MNFTILVKRSHAALYILAVIGFLMPAASSAQLFEYKGKRLELDLSINRVGSHTYKADVKYEGNEQIKGKAKYLLLPNLEVNYAFGRRYGIGLEYRRGSCFVGHTVPLIHEFRPFSSGPNNEIYYFKFPNNHFLKTNFIGLVARRYSLDYHGPRSSFFELGLGMLMVQSDESDTYEYERSEREEIFIGPYEVETSLVVTEVVELARPKIKPMPFLKLGYTLRIKFDQVPDLFIDARVQFSSSFGLGQDTEIGGGNYRIEIEDEHDLEEVIKAFSYDYLQRQNWMMYGLKVGYLL